MFLLLILKVDLPSKGISPSNSHLMFSFFLDVLVSVDIQLIFFPVAAAFGI